MNTEWAIYPKILEINGWHKPDVCNFSRGALHPEGVIRNPSE